MKAVKGVVGFVLTVIAGMVVSKVVGPTVGGGAFLLGMALTAAWVAS